MNPFLVLNMNLVAINQVLLSENQIFLDEFKPSITLLPASAGTHIPSSIYSIMNENFF